MFQDLPLRIRIAYVASPVVGGAIILFAILNFEFGPKQAPSGGSTVPDLIVLVVLGASLLVFGVLRIIYVRRIEIEPI
jgi:hypothetical protein